MPPHEPVLKGKAAVRTWYDQFLTQLRTSSLTIVDREVLIGGEWATEIATFEWGLVPVGADRPSSIEAAMHRSGTMSQMDLAVRPRDMEQNDRAYDSVTGAVNGARAGSGSGTQRRPS